MKTTSFTFHLSFQQRKQSNENAIRLVFTLLHCQFGAHFIYSAADASFFNVQFACIGSHLHKKPQKYADLNNSVFQEKFQKLYVRSKRLPEGSIRRYEISLYGNNQLPHVLEDVGCMNPECVFRTYLMGLSQNLNDWSKDELRSLEVWSDISLKHCAR